MDLGSRKPGLLSRIAKWFSKPFLKHSEPSFTLWKILGGRGNRQEVSVWFYSSESFKIIQYLQCFSSHLKKYVPPVADMVRRLQQCEQVFDGEEQMRNERVGGSQRQQS